MKKVLLAIGFALGGILTSLAQAQIIDLTVDSAQSSVEISIAGSASSSSLSGNAAFDLQFSDPPSGDAQITDLDLVVDEALNFSFAFGLVSGSTSPGDVTLSMVTPGSPGTISGTSFAQLANLVALDGTLDVADPLGLAGGNQTFDLSEIEFPPFDFNSVNVTQLGAVITISSSFAFTDTVDLGAGLVPVVVDVTLVASGETGIISDFLGDVNMDSAVNFLDIGPFIAILSAGEFEAQADIDQSGEVDFLDIAPFIAILSGQ